MTRIRSTLLPGLALVLACNEPSSDDTGGEGGPTDSGILTVSASQGDETSATGSDDVETADDSTSTGMVPGTDTEMNCGEVDFVLQAIPPNVMLVLDKSGSMVSDNDANMDGELDGYWDHDADPGTAPISRWNSLYNVVDFVATPLDSQINFGAMLFPSEAATNQYSISACLVENAPEIPVASENAAAILAGIPAADTVDLRGATPATRGIETAVAHLETLDPEVPRFLVLVTDGAANCSADYDAAPEALEVYDEHLPEVVDDAFTNRGIPTFVVGIDIIDALTGVGNDGAPEANTFDSLNAVADAGGRPRPGAEKFYNAGNEIELMAALQEIAGEVVSCVIPLDPPPVHPDFIEVVIGGQTIDRVEDCATENGWVYVNPDGPYDALQLCGTACDQLVDVGTVDATYGCPPAG